MKLTLSVAQKLLLLKEGEKLPFSKLKHAIIVDMISNGVLGKEIQGRSKSRIFLSEPNSLVRYLKNHFGIDNLAEYVTAFQKGDLSRAEAVDVSSNSKLKPGRTFEGFLVNSYQPIECTLNGKSISIHPRPGTFMFICDYRNFHPPSTATIIGVENAENFRCIEKQKYLFKDINPLFVSRYPQNQSKDLLKWLQVIPNDYLHFGDFDFSGLNIYWNEYKVYLSDSSRFFVPENMEAFMIEKGNRDLYDRQKVLFPESEVEEVGLVEVLKCIRKHKKGLEQEVFIQSTEESN